MKSNFRFWSQALAASLALTPLAAKADSTLVTHLFPRTNGEADANTGANRDEWLEVGKSGSIAWITYVTGGADLSLTTGSALTLYVDSVHSGGVLKLFALQSPVTVPELDVESGDLDFNDTLPIATLSLGTGDQEKVVRLSLGSLLAEGDFHGLVLKGYSGLRVDFGAKDAPVQPLIELKYGFATPEQVNLAIAAGDAAEAAATAAASSADAAAGSATDASGYASASASSATTSAGAATSAAGSATAAAGSATSASTAASSAVGSASAASASATAASGSASSASSSASSASTSASASAASETAAHVWADSALALISIPGQVILTTQSTAPSGFSHTGIRVNYESPWDTGGTMPAVNYYGASAVAGKKLYVTGGYNGSTDVNHTNAYDPTTKTWTSKTAVPLTGVEGHTLTEVGGKLYLLGGILPSGSMVSTSHCFDTATNSWSTITSMPTTALNHAAAAYNGKIYVFGGSVSYPSGSAITITHVYDIAGNSWSTKSGVPTWRGILTATTIGDKIHLLGGSISGTYSSLHDVFDPTADSWSAAAPLPEKRAYHAAVADNGRIYVFGGILTGVTPSATALQYDEANDSWRSLLPMASARYRPAIGLIDGKVTISGGKGATSILSSSEVYTLPKTIYLVERN